MSLIPKLRPTSPCSRRRWRLFSAIAISVLALAVFCFLFRAPLLVAAANAWVVNEPPGKADAIVILGGGIENRPFAAARLYGEGMAPLVLYMDVKNGPAEELGVALSESEMTRRILRTNGVPESALAMIGHHVASTFDESCAVRAWAKKVDAKSILIPTDLFHTRRVAWIFRKQFRGSDMEIHVQAVRPLAYSQADWWQHEEGLVDFQNEVIKLAYYHFKY